MALLIFGFLAISEAGPQLRRMLKRTPVLADPVSEAHWQQLGWSKPFLRSPRR
jgi:hypothetical protein